MSGSDGWSWRNNRPAIEFGIGTTSPIFVEEGVNTGIILKTEF
jgi:hypothetical protein